MNRYINLWGLLWVVAILIPNMIFAMTCREGFVNHYQNKVVEALEPDKEIQLYINSPGDPLQQGLPYMIRCSI